MYKKQKLLIALLVPITVFGAFSLFNDSKKSFSLNTATYDPYKLTLNSSNAFNGSSSVTTKTLSTDTGAYNVDFLYTNASSSSNYHVRLASNGTLANKDHILSITNITANFITTGNLQFRTSYDANNWSSFVNMDSGYRYELGSNPYYIEFKASGAYVDIASIVYEYSCQINPDAESSDEGVYTLVTKTSDLVIGDNYVIAAKDYNYAISETQNENNRNSTSISKNTTDKTISWADSSNVCEFELKQGSVSNTYAFYDESNSGYIYAASSSKNYLRTQTSIDANASFSISISSSSTSIVAQGSSSRNKIRYNDSNDLFSCYSSGQKDIVLYHKVGGEVPTPVDEVGFIAQDNTTSYTVGDIFNSKKQLVVKACFSDGTQTTLNNSQYTYSVKKNGVTIDASKPFNEAGNYSLEIYYKTYNPVVIPFTVDAVSLTKIEMILSNDEYIIGDSLELEDNILVDLTYSDASKIENLEYGDLDEYGLSLTLLNPSGVSKSLSSEFDVTGNWTLKVYLTTNPSIYDSVSIKVDNIPGTSDYYQLIKSNSDLEVGEQYIIASVSKGMTMGAYGSSYFNPVTTTFTSSSTKIEEVPTSTTIFTLGKSSTYYTFANDSNSLLGSSGIKKISWNGTETNWSISISSDGDATITNKTTSNGGIYYNFSSPRFTTYASYDQNNMAKVQLFKRVSGTPIYPTSISLTPSSVSIQETEQTQLNVVYTPTNTNQMNITWTSSNPSIASVSDSGLVTALKAGKTTITAIAKNASKQDITATCSVTVTEYEGYKAPKISMQKDMGDYIENNVYDIDACPSTGTAKLLVIPVWFNDSSTYISSANKSRVRDDIEKAYFGTNSETGWRSVKSFYEEESKGRLTLNGTCTDWYNSGKKSSDFYSESTGADATEELVTSATNWYFKQSGESRKSYDLDGNGHLDGVMLIYGSPDYSALGNNNAGNMWAYCFWLQNDDANTSSPTPNVFFWASYDFIYGSKDSSISSYYSGDTSHCSVDSHTFIHEMGHVFGLEDYYDYSYNYNPAGAFSMQDYNVGGHDAYSALQLGWGEAYVPTETCTITLNDFQSSGESIILSPSWNDTDSPFDEYLLLELFSPSGLNEMDCTYQYDSTYPLGPNAVGVRLWHVDARLLYFTDGYYRSSNMTSDPNHESLYGVTKAMSNTYYSSDSASYCSPLCNGSTSPYGFYNELQLIRNNTSSTYRPTDKLNSNSLFKAGSSFSMSTFKNQFYNSGKLNSQLDLGWSFHVDSISGYQAVITVTKL